MTTIADFVENVFIPEHVRTKSASSQAYYQAMLKHVLTPEKVDSLFGANSQASKLKTIPNWPYLDNVRFCDVRPADVQQLMSAAIERGYSQATIRNIRVVISTMFALAKKMKWFTGENPAGLVRLPEMEPRPTRTLTLSQVNRLLKVMRYPAKEMALMAMLTDLNMAEICSLQWKHINLETEWCDTHFGRVPPRSIAIRSQWQSGGLDPVKPSRNRNVPIPDPLLNIFVRLRRRPEFTSDEDFVLVSRVGRPIRMTDMAATRLKRIGKELGMPWLSWQVFRRTHSALAYPLGMHSLENGVHEA